MLYLVTVDGRSADSRAVTCVDCCGVAAVSAVVLIGACVHRRMPITGHAAIDRLIESAGTAGLPTATLVRKSQEGFVKDAADSTILRALEYVVRECTASTPRLLPTTLRLTS